MEGLVIELLVELSITLVSGPLLFVDMLQAFKLTLLLLCVVLEDVDAFPHLLLHEHVVLHATLEHLRGLASILTDPARVALFIQVHERHLVYVEQYVVHWLVRIVNYSCLLVEVERADAAPIDALLLVELEIEVAVAEDVVLFVNHFDFAFFNVGACCVAHFNSNLNCKGSHRLSLLI